MLETALAMRRATPLSTFNALIDHALWFHRPIDLSDWVLSDQSSPSGIAGRGLATSTMYNRAGQLGWLGGWVLSILAALLVHGGLYCVALVQCLSMVVYRRRFHQRQRNWWLAQIPVLSLFLITAGTHLGHFVGHRMAETNTAIAASVTTGIATTLAAFMLKNMPRFLAQN